MESLSNLNDLIPSAISIFPALLALILVWSVWHFSASILPGILKLRTRTVVLFVLCTAAWMMTTCAFLEFKTISFGGADGYTIRAENVLNSGVFGYGTIPTALFPPGYSFLLLPALVLFGLSRWSVLLTNLAVLLAAVLIVRHVLVRLKVPVGAANACALAVLLYPNRLVSVFVPFSDIPFSLAYMCSFGFALLANEYPGRLRYTTLAGITAAVAALIRANGIPLLLPLLVVIWLPSGRVRRERMRRIVLVTGSFLLVLLPWGVRNYVFVHRIVPVSTNFGVNLAMGNNPSRSTGHDPYSLVAWTASRWDSAGGGAWDESQRDSFFAVAGCTYIREHPGQFLANGLQKVGRTMVSDASMFGMLETYTNMRTIFFSVARSWTLTPGMQRSLSTLSSAGYLLLYILNNTLYYAGVIWTVLVLWKRRRSLSAREVAFVMVTVISLAIVFLLFGASRFKEPIPTIMLLVLGLDLARRGTTASQIERSQSPTGLRS